MSRRLHTALLLLCSLAFIFSAMPVQANTPSNIPREIGRLDLPDMTHLALAEPFAFAARGDELLTIDVSEPYAPGLRSSFTDSDIQNIRSLAIDGTQLFAIADWLVEGGRGYHYVSFGVFDVTDPMQPEPRHVSYANNISSNHRIRLSGGYAIVCNGREGTMVLRYSGLPEPEFTPWGGDYIVDVRIDNGFAYFVNFGPGYGFYVTDDLPSSEPTTLLAIDKLPLVEVNPDSRIVLHGDHAFISGSTLQAVLISNPESIGLLGELHERFEGMVGTDSWLLAWNAERLALIDISDPSRIVEVADLPYQGIRDVAVSGDIAYVLVPEGLRIVDLGRNVINVQVQGQGLVSPAGNQRLHNGGSCTLNFEPAPGYELIDVQVDGESRGPLAAHSFDGVQEDHEVKVLFEISEEELARRKDLNQVGMRSILF